MLFISQSQAFFSSSKSLRSLNLSLWPLHWLELISCCLWQASPSQYWAMLRDSLNLPSIHITLISLSNWDPVHWVIFHSSGHICHLHPLLLLLAQWKQKHFPAHSLSLFYYCVQCPSVYNCVSFSGLSLLSRSHLRSLRLGGKRSYSKQVSLLMTDVKASSWTCELVAWSWMTR